MSIKVFDKFSDCICQDGVLGGWLGDGTIARIGIDVPPSSRLHDAAGALGDSLGIRARKHKGGRSLVLVNMATNETREFHRSTVYALCEANHDEPIEAAERIMRHIHGRFGPGEVFFTASPSYLCKRHEMPAEVGVRRLGNENDDPALPPAFTDDPRRRVIVGAYYVHEQQEPVSR